MIFSTKSALARRAWLVVPSVALCGWLAAACGSDDKPDPTRIMTADGEIQGSVMGSSRQFLGIPYARPPVGDLRWRSPEKPEPWKDVRDATRFGKRCPQLANTTLQNAASNDEDCLYLNVWTPSPAPASPLPVMVWIHGGGHVNGSASEPVPFVGTGLFYSGEFLAENQGVVVVSLNYRLGVFGFFGHPGLVAEGRSGNQGLQDQQMALQWVHDNIARFGGDPGNVTIFGESAGSFDVCMHVAAPSSAGLFHAAISESGGCTTRLRTQAEAEAAAVAFASDQGCTGSGALACLRALSAETLMKSDDVAMGKGFGPDVDGWFMPDQPRAIYDAGNAAAVPYLLGSNTDEGTLFLPATQPASEQDYLVTLSAMFGARSEAVADIYPVSKFDSPSAALARVIGDSRLVCSTFDTAVRHAHAGRAVFLYNFDVPVPATVAPGLGATHGSELTSVFGTSPTFALDPVAKAVSDLVQRYWSRFARTGDPNGGSDPSWPKFVETANVRINIALQASTSVSNFRADECAFWRAQYDAQFAASGP